MMILKLRREIVFPPQNFVRSPSSHYEGALISLWLYKENNKLRDWKKKLFTLHIPSLRSTHTYDFVVLTSFTLPIEILLFMLQIGKAKDLSAPLRIM
jgi:hypothetical protein